MILPIITGLGSNVQKSVGSNRPGGNDLRSDKCSFTTIFDSTDRSTEVSEVGLNALRRVCSHVTPVPIHEIDSWPV